MVYKALAQGMPEHVAASSGGDVPGFMMVGRNLDTGSLYAVSNNDAIANTMTGKLIGLVSILLWAGVGFAGKAIGYIS